MKISPERKAFERALKDDPDNDEDRRLFVVAGESFHFNLYEVLFGGAEPKPKPKFKPADKVAQ